MTLEPFEVGYPIDFRRGGDTTKQFAAKTIQEVARIYDYMNALRVEMADQSAIEQALATARSELNSHKTSTNPHPNWSVNLTGQTTGNLDASRVSGKLSNATIDYGSVNGLSDYVSQNGGLRWEHQADIDYPNGTKMGNAKFSTGLQMLYGSEKHGSKVYTNEEEFSFTFPFSFYDPPLVLLTIRVAILLNDYNAHLQLKEVSETGFTYVLQFAHGYPASAVEFTMNYFAIGC